MAASSSTGSDATLLSSGNSRLDTAKASVNTWAVSRASRGGTWVSGTALSAPSATRVGPSLVLAAEAGATNVRFFSDCFNELLAACDVLISGSSTVVLEAILLGRRTICINFSTEPDRYPYASEGGSLGAKTGEELAAALDAVLDPQRAQELTADRMRFLARHVGPSAEGQAAAVFVRTVLDAIAG